MYKFLIIVIFILSSCSGFVETNELLVPPIAKDEIKLKKDNKSLENKSEEDKVEENKTIDTNKTNKINTNETN